MKIKPKANKKWRNKDYRYLTESCNYTRLSREELDIATHGIPFEGKRYPLCYVFWGDKRKCKRVRISLTGEIGTLIGESIIELPRGNIQRGIVKLTCGRITDLSYSVLDFV